MIKIDKGDSRMGGVRNVSRESRAVNMFKDKTYDFQRKKCPLRRRPKR